MKNARRYPLGGAVFLVLLAIGRPASADITYTSNADFDEGSLVGLNHDSGAVLRLNVVGSTFPFIWIAKSGAGTVVKINTETGQILGEYSSAPSGRGRNPSRTTVDQEGNVWVGNRDESSSVFSGGPSMGSVVKIGLLEANQCVDRNGDGIITTSTGLFDVKPWTNAGDVDFDGGVETAVDECILRYVRTNGINVRSLAVDRNNNVWVGGGTAGVSIDHQIQDLLDGATGAIIKTVDLGSYKCGSYGGLVDAKGILWSAGYAADKLLRLDPSVDPPTWQCLKTQGRYSYGLALDKGGNLWNGNFENQTVLKFNSDGVIVGGPYDTGGGSRGMAVTEVDNDLWVANSYDDTVVRLSNDGVLKATIKVGQYPTGVAVDAAGKVWVTDYNSHDASRIDPATNSVDLSVYLGDKAYPYNYSDMTGMVSRNMTSPQGNWTVVYDSAGNGTRWKAIAWNTEPEGSVPDGASITVEARAADTEAGLGGVAYVPMSNGGAVTGLSGRFVQVRTTLKPNTDAESPVLSDLSISQYQGVECDLNNDSAVNVDDLNLILAGRGSNDQRLDIDKDGRVTVLDARKCVLRCSKPRCVR